VKCAEIIVENFSKLIGEIFASYTPDKELITKIYRELKKLNSPQINDPMKKWAN
jgi:hypothetical protein